VAPATAKGPTGRHGGLTGDLLCFASLHGKKSYIQRRQQRQKKAERKRNGIPKGDAKKRGREKVGL